MDLSVVIITKNEAHNIAGALESVSWASDVVVVDILDHAQRCSVRACRF